MRLIKLKDGAYLNPEKIILIKISDRVGFQDDILGYDVDIIHSKDCHSIEFSELTEAEEYLTELVDLCQETSEILDRLDEVEAAIKYIPGGLEYQKSSDHFEDLRSIQSNK